MSSKTIDQVDVSGKRVLMRVDFNVPIDRGGAINDDSRIRAALPSIRSVTGRGGTLILMSHLGRPDGKGYESELSLKPVADRLAELTDTNVDFPDTDCISKETAAAVGAMTEGTILLLENLRFHQGEMRNDAVFAAKLAGYGDIYCNEAFGTAHRDHASMVAVPRVMEGKPRVAGLLLEKELRFFGEALHDPARPFVAVLGGAKVSDKLGVIENLMNRVDTILIGGAMAFTFLRALEKPIGSSKVQLGMLDDAQRALDAAAASPTDLILPTDHVCGREITPHTPVKVFGECIEERWMGLDIGPETVARYGGIVGGAKTIVWNGPVGVFEVTPFDVGTRRIAEAIAEATKQGATSIVGGGDSAAAVQEFGLEGQFSHVSTGGGAGLQMLEGKAFTSIGLLETG